jgi:hypothetical protein
MNDYLIKYKVATVAELPTPFQLEGYQFTSYHEDWWACGAWVAFKVIRANSAGEARFEFMKDLIPQVEKCSVVSQCAFRIVANSYIIYKQTNNPERIIFIFFVRNVGHTGLVFQEEELAQVKKLAIIPNQHAFMYIMEASNATTFYTRLIMLIGAVEAFAGEVTKGKMTMTNSAQVKKILGDSLYDRLYEYGKGLRHKLLHGNVQAHHLFDGLTDEIYSKLLGYLRTTYDIQIPEGVVHPQRNFHDNFEAMSMFKKFLNEEVLGLKMIEETITGQIMSGLRENVILTDCRESPKNY